MCNDSFVLRAVLVWIVCGYNLLSGKACLCLLRVWAFASRVSVVSTLNMTKSSKSLPDITRKLQLVIDASDHSDLSFHGTLWYPPNVFRAESLYATSGFSSPSGQILIVMLAYPAVIVLCQCGRTEARNVSLNILRVSGTEERKRCWPLWPEVVTFSLRLNTTLVLHVGVRSQRERVQEIRWGKSDPGPHHLCCSLFGLFSFHSDWSWWWWNGLLWAAAVLILPSQTIDFH